MAFEHKARFHFSLLIALEKYGITFYADSEFDLRMLMKIFVTTANDLLKINKMRKFTPKKCVTINF